MHGREGRAFERFHLRITRDGSREPSVDTPRGTDDRDRCVVITEPGQAMGQIQLQAKGLATIPGSGLLKLTEKIPLRVQSSI